MIDSKIMETTKSILKEFGNTYFSDKGTLKRNKVIEDLDAYTPMLMKALLANQLIHDTYTESVVIDDKSVEIFKLNQFIEMFTYKEYWPDSYTKFENKIGLTAGGKFIDETADVVLDFPFKDTVLKAGMTKEDQKDAVEPFLHETIAKAEIDQLLEPKIFVNATKYDKENLEGVSTDKFDDGNLIIKGNNLIALYSLKKRYAGEVKLIYLDPPYYFDKTKKSDDFLYNPNFKLSAWLCFMKSRLEIAKELLSNEGVLVISIGEDGQAYLKILMDEVIGHKNFVETFLWRNSDNSDSLSGKSRSGVEYLHAYEINKDLSKKWIGKQSENGDAPLLNNGNGVTKKNFEANTIRFNIPDGKYSQGTYPSVHLDNDLYVKNGKNENAITLEGHFKWSQGTIDKEISNGTYFIIKSNKFSIRFQRKEASNMAPEKWVNNRYLAKIFGIGTNEDATAHMKKMGFDFTNPKPESLLAFLIRAVTNEHDLVLDFFMGSATTQAVAMKMNRRFIGIEQMDYIKTVSVERLKKVIDGEQGGISKDVNWQGGGSFVYTELMEKNQGYLKDVQHAETTKQLENVVNRMIAGGADFDFRVDVEKVMQEPKYQARSLADKKQLMVKVIDKNQLYYAYSDMEDRDVQGLMSESDIAFNKSFYGERDL
ncbi:site-specific DNA-methyltransferase [Limosilactobacillus fermentum]